MIGAILQVSAVAVYGNLLEWLVHKYVLHGWGRDKRGWFAYHWHTHHANVRFYGLVDPDYRDQLPYPAEQIVKEKLGIWLLAIVHFWFFRKIAPFAALAFFGYAKLYLYCHTQSHRDATWARRWLPWHVDHHFGRNPDLNWCLTFPLWDWIMGTRVARERQG